MLRAAAVGVVPDDLARVVNAGSSGALGAERIVERGVGAAAIEEAVRRAIAVRVVPDDLPSIVDATRNGARVSRWTVERSVGAGVVKEPCAVTLLS